MNKRARAHALLLLTAMIWGSAFVAQDVAMDSMQPFTFNGIRALVAGVALFLFVMVKKRAFGKRRHTEKDHPFRLFPWKGGLLCGLMLFMGTSFQQIGIAQTSAGKAGFVTALYIVFVPLAGIFQGRRIRPVIWISVALCTLGLYFLCVTESFHVDTGDVYLLLCAICFTGHILVIDRFSYRVDPIELSCVQFLVCSGISMVFMALFEQPSWAALVQGVVPILYAGLISGGVGYTLQVFAQRDTDPAIASLIMCLEGVFAVLAAWLILGDTLSLRELLGCGLMFAGVVLPQGRKAGIAV